MEITKPLRPLSILMGSLSVALLLLGWKLASLGIAEIILPPPEKVFVRLFELGSQADFWEAVGASLLRALAGFAAALAIGLFAGILSGLSPAARAFFFPPILVARATPVVALVLVILLAVGAESAPALSAVLMCFPLIAESAAAGIANTDKRLLEMAGVYGVGKLGKLLGIYLPSSMPFILSGAVSALGLSWKVTVAAEVLSRPAKAIGSALADAKMLVETTDVYAWTLCALILSIATDRLFALIRGRMAGRATQA